MTNDNISINNSKNATESITSTEEYAPFETFSDLEIAMEDLGYSQKILDNLEAIGQDETDQFSSPQFWDIMAVAAKDEALDMYNAGVDTREISSFLFMCSLPNAMRIEGKPKNERSFEERVQLCEVNLYLRDIIKGYPETTQEQTISNAVTVMTHQIANLNAKTTGGADFQKKNREARNKIQKTIEDMIKGAKNEVWLEQILQKANIKYRTTTPEEDARGKDFIIFYPGDEEVDMDVKSSTEELRQELLKGGMSLEDQPRMFIEKRNRDGSRKLLVVPYVFPSDIPIQRTQTGVEHRMLIPDSKLEEIAQKMDEDVFYLAEHVA
jgi:hypothetical protein